MRSIASSRASRSARGRAERRILRRVKVPPAPDATSLHEAALAYLSQRPSSVAQMKRVLGRRVSAWGRRAARAGAEEAEVASAAARARTAIEEVLARLQRSGLLDDGTFAKQRAASLTRAGKSRRAVAFDLAQRGISDEVAREHVPTDAETELAAAVTFTRKRRLGPFAKTSVSMRDDEHRRALGALARAGYSFSTAERALRLDRETAEEILRRVRPVGW